MRKGRIRQADVFLMGSARSSCFTKPPEALFCAERSYLHEPLAFFSRQGLPFRSYKASLQRIATKSCENFATCINLKLTQKLQHEMLQSIQPTIRESAPGPPSAPSDPPRTLLQKPKPKSYNSSHQSGTCGFQIMVFEQHPDLR